MYSWHYYGVVGVVMFSKNLLAVGITVLFLGLAIQPSIATVQPEKLVVEPNVDDIDGLVAQLRVAVNDILQKYGHNPIIRSLCNMILDLTWFPGKIIICNLIKILAIGILYTMGICIVFNLSVYFILILAIFAEALSMVSIGLQCPPIFPVNDYPLPLKSIFALSETHDITNLAECCPCLQK